MAGLTIDDPVTLTQALISDRIIPGDTLVLLPGTYTASVKSAVSGGADQPGKGVFPVRINGTAANPIIIKPQTPGTVRINGGLELLNGNASYIIVQDLEIAPTPTIRNILRASLDYPNCVYCSAPGCAFYGNYLHDGSEGFAVFGTGGCTIRGNVVSNIGWYDPGDSRYHGTGIYTHNNPGGTVDILNNIWHTFGDNGVDLWSASTNAVRDYNCLKNVVLYSTLMCACEEGVCEDNSIDDNHVYRGGLRLGRPSPLNGLVYVRRNRVYQQYVPFILWWQKAAVVTDNIFSNDLQVSISYNRAEDETNTVDTNTYRGAAYGVYSYYHERAITWAEWQAMNYDVNSTITTGLPTTNEVFVYPFVNSERWYGMVVIWNWENAETVDVDLADLSLENGDYNLVNVQDLTDSTAFTYDGSNVSVSMTDHTVTEPTAWEGTCASSTFPAFGCFLVEKPASESFMARRSFAPSFLTNVRLPSSSFDPTTQFPTRLTRIRNLGGRRI